MTRTLRPGYNCAHFSVEVWYQETGDDISEVLGTFLAPRGQRTAQPELRHSFVRLHAPHAPCIVLFRRGRATPHVGVFVRKRVFHLSDSGAIRQPLELARVGYTSVRYYGLRSTNH